MINPAAPAVKRWLEGGVSGLILDAGDVRLIGCDSMSAFEGELTIAFHVQALWILNAGLTVLADVGMEILTGHLLRLLRFARALDCRGNLIRFMWLYLLIHGYSCQ